MPAGAQTDPNVSDYPDRLWMTTARRRRNGHRPGMAPGTATLRHRPAAVWCTGARRPRRRRGSDAGCRPRARVAAHEPRPLRAVDRRRRPRRTADRRGGRRASRSFGGVTGWAGLRWAGGALVRRPDAVTAGRGCRSRSHWVQRRPRSRRRHRDLAGAPRPARAHRSRRPADHVARAVALLRDAVRRRRARGRRAYSTWRRTPTWCRSRRSLTTPAPHSGLDGHPAVPGRARPRRREQLVAVGGRHAPGLDARRGLPRAAVQPADLRQVRPARRHPRPPRPGGRRRRRVRRCAAPRRRSASP